MRSQTSKVVAPIMAGLLLSLALGGCDAPDVSQLVSVPDRLAGLAQGIPDPLAKTGVEEALAARATKSPQVSDAALVTPGTLTVGLKSSSVGIPFCAQLEGGEFVGLDVDLASAVADELGLKVSFVSVPSASGALGKSCDVVMDTRAGDSSSAAAVGGYAQSATAFFHKGQTGVAKVEDLSSKTVGLQDGSVSQKALRSTGLVMEEKTFANLNEAFAALDAGGVDYVLCDAYSGAFLSMGCKDIAFAGTLDAPVTQGIGVLPTNTELQGGIKSALDTLQSNGIEDGIRSRWLGGMPQLGDTSQVREVPAPVQEEPAEEAAPAEAGSNAASV